MTDDAAAAGLRARLNACGISIPDDDLAGVADAYCALRRAARRVLTAEQAELDIATTFDPSEA